MLTGELLEQAREEALKQISEKAFKDAVEEHKKILRAKRAHFFPKKFVLQLPFRLDDWYKSK